MSELHLDAAYVSTPDAAARAASPLDDLDVLLLALLQTPHTTQSLQRQLASAATAPGMAEIVAAMRRLLDGELIELSPDS